jgi:cytochrome oxidase Cu insertion factor (SCO1/SenC/PrrC family)
VTAAVAAFVALSACSGSKNEEKPQTADAALSAPAIAVGPEVGSRAPAFSLPNGRGEAVALADYAGKPVAVVFYRGQW